MNILLLSGSFHSRSRSLVIARHLQAVLHDHVTTIPRLDQLPFYCEDLAAERPVAVATFIDQVAASDGLLCCTPEYNHSLPAVLKNAIDWASRPAFQSALKNKPVSFITQAVSAVGGARAQAHLKLVFDATLSDIHLCHEMMIPNIDQVIQNGVIADAHVCARLERHAMDFLHFISTRRAR